MNLSFIYLDYIFDEPLNPNHNLGRYRPNICILCGDKTKPLGKKFGQKKAWDRTREHLAGRYGGAKSFTTGKCFKNSEQFIFYAHHKCNADKSIEQSQAINSCIDWYKYNLHPSIRFNKKTTPKRGTWGRTRYRLLKKLLQSPK